MIKQVRKLGYALSDIVAFPKELFSLHDSGQIYSEARVLHERYSTNEQYTVYNMSKDALIRYRGKEYQPIDFIHAFIKGKVAERHYRKHEMEIIENFNVFAQSLPETKSKVINIADLAK